MPPEISIMPITRGSIGVFDFAQNNDSFVFLDANKPRNVWISSITAGTPKNLTNNNNPNIQYYSARFSADGQRIAIVSLEQFPDKTKKPIWHVLICKDGAIKEVYSTSASLQLIGWSRTGGLLMAGAVGDLMPSPMNLDILALTIGGAIRKLISIEKAYPFTLTMTADKTTLAFTSRNDTRDDIWTVPISPGAKPKKVTSNSNPHLFFANLTFSTDGKSVFFDKQGEVDKISMFENFN